jgi:protein arginine kinase
MHEQNARERLLEDRRVYLEDRIGRAFGVLTYARVLSSHEALDMLAVLRLGVELGMIRKLTIARINEVMLLSQPGHLQKMAGRALGSEERDALRANLVRDYLKGIDIGG